MFLMGFFLIVLLFHPAPCLLNMFLFEEWISNLLHNFYQKSKVTRYFLKFNLLSCKSLYETVIVQVGK